jgi:hypothetical protein
MPGGILTNVASIDYQEPINTLLTETEYGIFHVNLSGSGGAVMSSTVESLQVTTP